LSADERSVSNDITARKKRMKQEIAVAAAGVTAVFVSAFES
jgi:hypothetical protein